MVCGCISHKSNASVPFVVSPSSSPFIYQVLSPKSLIILPECWYWYVACSCICELIGLFVCVFKPRMLHRGPPAFRVRSHRRLRGITEPPPTVAASWRRPGVRYAAVVVRRTSVRQITARPHTRTGERSSLAAVAPPDCVEHM